MTVSMTAVTVSVGNRHAEVLGAQGAMTVVTVVTVPPLLLPCRGMAMRDIAELMRDPAAALALPAEEARRLLVELAPVLKALELAAAGPGQEPHRNGRPEPEADLLTPEQAARKLGLSIRQLYRRSGRLPFVRKLGARTLRFDAEGLERWLKRGGVT